MKVPGDGDANLHSGISIDELRTLCSKGNIKWTAHIAARLQERNVNPSDVKNCILTGEVIEQYPSDYPHPSCLVSGVDVSAKPLHVVIGVGAGHLWLITAYYPDENKWEADLKTRKGLQQ